MINGMIDLVVEEDSPPEFHLETTEVLGEVGAIKPDDDVAFDCSIGQWRWWWTSQETVQVKKYVSFHKLSNVMTR
jgi:hypothetical protein